MLDIEYIRSNKKEIEKILKLKRCNVDLEKLLDLDFKRRKFITDIEQIKAQKNNITKDIIARKSKDQDTTDLVEKSKSLNAQIAEGQKELNNILEAFNKAILYIPNVIAPDVPKHENKIIAEYGKKREFSFKPKDHVKLCTDLGLIDFQRSGKLTGSGFLLFTGIGALLERALIWYMLDFHIKNHGYTELFPPFIAKREIMKNTGQIPKLEEDMYKLTEDEGFLIPTAEVPVTNFYAGDVLEEKELPKKFVSYTACFRREAGAYGKQTRGMKRVHQFDKVELVNFTKPQESEAAHQKLLDDAREVLDMFDLHYRVVLLSGTDISFAAYKCYDIEVWAPGLGEYLEVSTCSNFCAFQAKRGAIKYRCESGGLDFVHTLNGSGVALPRLYIALIEQYQNEDGSVTVPEPIIPHLGIHTIRRLQ